MSPDEQAPVAAEPAAEEEASQDTTLASVRERWRQPAYFAYAFIALCAIYIGFKVARQGTCNGLVARLSGQNWEQAKTDLVGMGEVAMPYTVRAFYYNLDVSTRRRAGETLLESLQKQQASQGGGAPEEWQNHIRAVSESDMASKALRDEDPEVRQLAAKIVTILGFEHYREEGRYRRWEKMEELIAKLRGMAPSMAKPLAKLFADEERMRREREKLENEYEKLDPKKQAEGADTAAQEESLKAIRGKIRAVSEALKASAGKRNRVIAPIMDDWRIDEAVGDFGNSVLVGIIDTDKAPGMRTAATAMLDDMLATAYRADDREEMIKLVGTRRLRILLRLLSEDVPGVKGVLGFSPHIRAVPNLLPSVRQALSEKRAEGDEAYDAMLAYVTGLHSDVEEGRKGVLDGATPRGRLGDNVGYRLDLAD